MAADPTSRQLVVFSLGTEEYALAIERVQEVIRFVEPRAVSTSEDSVCGVISLRGRIVPVLDLSARLKVTFAVPHEDRRIVVVHDGQETVGLMVDAVAEVITVELSKFADAPVAGADHISAVVQVDDRLLVLLDPGTLTGRALSQSNERPEAVA